MPKRYLIIAAVFFALGFALATYWQSILRGLDTATRDAGDAKAVAAAHEKNAELGAAIHEADSTSVKEIHDATLETERLNRDLATGAVRLQLNATCPELPQIAAGSGVIDGTRARPASVPGQHREAQPAPQLSRAAEPDYLALRQGIQKCRIKVTALQAILNEERGLGR